jgi:hypothetical protein
MLPSALACKGAVWLVCKVWVALTALAWPVMSVERALALWGRASGAMASPALVVWVKVCMAWVGDMVYMAKALGYPEA